MQAHVRTAKSFPDIAHPIHEDPPSKSPIPPRIMILIP